jgi:hypothetical protein
MVAAVKVYPNKKLAGIQRTWINLDGSGKADLDPSKMSLGSTLGGAVQLADAGEILGLAEGVETALSVQQELHIPVWAVLGSNNFGNVVLPPLPLASEIRLYIDGDDDSRDAISDVREAFIPEGRRVVVVPAPEGHDFNDVLTGKVLT